MAPGSSATAAARAPARAAASTSNRSRTSSPSWTRASAITRSNGRTSANSTTADPRSPALLARIAGHVVDDVVEERRELPRRMRPRDQDDGDGRSGKDHEGVLRRRLPFLSREEGTKAYGNGEQQHGSPPLSGWTATW